MASRFPQDLPNDQSLQLSISVDLEGQSFCVKRFEIEPNNHNTPSRYIFLRGSTLNGVPHGLAAELDTFCPSNLDSSPSASEYSPSQKHSSRAEDARSRPWSIISFPCTVSDTCEHRDKQKTDIIRHEKTHFYRWRCPSLNTKCQTSKKRQSFKREDYLTQHLKKIHRDEGLTKNPDQCHITLPDAEIPLDCPFKNCELGGNSLALRYDHMLSEHVTPLLSSPWLQDTALSLSDLITPPDSMGSEALDDVETASQSTIIRLGTNGPSRRQSFDHLQSGEPALSSIGDHFETEQNPYPQPSATTETSSSSDPSSSQSEDHQSNSTDNTSWDGYDDNPGGAAGGLGNSHPTSGAYHDLYYNIHYSDAYNGTQTGSNYGWIDPWTLPAMPLGPGSGKPKNWNFELVIQEFPEGSPLERFKASYDRLDQFFVSGYIDPLSARKHVNTYCRFVQLYRSADVSKASHTKQSMEIFEAKYKADPAHYPMHQMLKIWDLVMEPTPKRFNTIHEQVCLSIQSLYLRGVQYCEGDELETRPRYSQKLDI